MPGADHAGRISLRAGRDICDRLLNIDIEVVQTCAAKCAAFLAAPTVGWLLAAQSLQMLGYGLFTPTSVFFVNENVPAADRTQGQTLMMVAGNGLGGVLGSFFIGRALDFGGINFALALCLAACLIAALLAWFALRLPKEISKEEPT